MSRIGIQPVAIPEGVSVKEEGLILVCTNGKETLQVPIHKLISIKVADGIINVDRADNSTEAKSLHGTTRVLIDNALHGLKEGWTKQLEIHGSGYRASVADNNLELHLGFSHIINYVIPTGITVTVQKNTITVSGHDKQLVGHVAAEIRQYRKPEPYKGKGIRYKGEHIIRKVGKALKSTA